VVAQDHLQRILKELLKSAFPCVEWIPSDVIPEQVNYDWIINAMPREKSMYNNFGERCVTAFLFSYQGNNGNCCQMIQMENAWCFILPVSKQTSCLQIMHLPDDEQSWETAIEIMRKHTGLVLKDEQAPSKTTFAAYPRFIKKSFDNKEIAISQSLARYDPIGGDGTGNALRSAVWTSRIIINDAEKNNAKEFLQAYQAAISKHFSEHLRVCAEFYKDYKGWANEFL